MGSIADRLGAVQRLEDAKEKTEQYKKLLAELVAAAAEADIKDYVEHSEWCATAPLSGLKFAPAPAHPSSPWTAHGQQQRPQVQRHGWTLHAACVFPCCPSPTPHTQSWPRASTCPWAGSCCLQSQRSCQSCQQTSTNPSPTSKHCSCLVPTQPRFSWQESSRSTWHLLAFISQNASVC
jgi:hypothetical protein